MCEFLTVLSYPTLSFLPQNHRESITSLFLFCKMQIVARKLTLSLSTRFECHYYWFNSFHPPSPFCPTHPVCKDNTVLHGYQTASDCCHFSRGLLLFCFSGSKSKQPFSLSIQNILVFWLIMIMWFISAAYKPLGHCREIFGNWGINVACHRSKGFLP